MADTEASRSAPTSPNKPLPELPMTLNPRADMNSSVINLVSRFNTLEVTDRAEEAVSKQLRRLESSLRRAEMAREEAESEVRGLRNEVKSLKSEVKELVEVGEEWVVEKKALKSRGEEYEVRRDETLGRLQSVAQKLTRPTTTEEIRKSKSTLQDSARKTRRSHA